MARLFVAIWPPDDVLDRLADIDRPKDQGVKWVPQENLHITLRFLGDADDRRGVDRLDDVLLPAATAVVGPAFDLLGERSLISPVTGVDELAAGGPAGAAGPGHRAANGSASRATSPWRASPVVLDLTAVPADDSTRRSTSPRSRSWPARCTTPARCTRPSPPGPPAERSMCLPDERT
jgi:hypothetical protein